MPLHPIAAAASLLGITNVTLRRGPHTVFNQLTLQLNEARIGLIGDNGCGKSSLFRMICGLDIPQSGTVTVRGLDTRQISSKRPGMVGMMFQNPDDQIIFPTVEEELALSLSPTGVSRQAALIQARTFLQTRGLSHWSARTIASLSQGQRQHVCWLALLVASPTLMLLDEPFASLDLPGQARLQRDIAQASQQVMVSTHQLEHVNNFERVIWLDHGCVHGDGPGPDICAAYRADVLARAATPMPPEL